MDRWEGAKMTAPPDITKFKPCPFCDGKVIDTLRDNKAWPANHWCECLRKKCGAMGPMRNTITGAIAAWNRRKP